MNSNCKAPERTYQVKVVCENCGESWAEYIQKGVTVDYHLADKECPNCGCKMVKRKIPYIAQEKESSSNEYELPPLVERKYWGPIWP